MTFTFLVKEKAEILQQVDSLTQIKDELTSQVASLTTELEKERSKVHSLQNEHSKAKVIQGSSTAYMRVCLYCHVLCVSSLETSRSHVIEFAELLMCHGRDQTYFTELDLLHR